jgi:tetrahydromethanopterin S-methyltransferase subunit B
MARLVLPGRDISMKIAGVLILASVGIFAGVMLIALSMVSR